MFALGAIFLCLCFALGSSKCLEISIDIQYTREQFQFHWDWKSDRVYIAEIEEEAFLTEEWIQWKKHIFKNRDFHPSVQRQFLSLLRVPVQEHPDVNRRMDGVFRRISPMDFLQGSRTLVALREVINEVIASEIPDL